MIVVGVLVPAASGGMAVEIARQAAATGARTEVVGVAPTGPIGDRQLVGLAAAGVGHATVTRSGATGIEAADLELALRYLPDVRVISLVSPAAALVAVAHAAAAWSGATLVLIGPLDADAVAALGGPGDRSANGEGAGPSAPIVLDPPPRDPDGAFAGVVGALAVRLDAGEDPAAAWAATVATLALDPV